MFFNSRREAIRAVRSQGDGLQQRWRQLSVLTLRQRVLQVRLTQISRENQTLQDTQVHMRALQEGVYDPSPSDGPQARRTQYRRQIQMQSVQRCVQHESAAAEAHQQFPHARREI